MLFSVRHFLVLRLFVRRHFLDLFRYRHFDRERRARISPRYVCGKSDRARQRIFACRLFVVRSRIRHRRAYFRSVFQRQLDLRRQPVFFSVRHFLVLRLFVRYNLQIVAVCPARILSVYKDIIAVKRNGSAVDAEIS